MSDDLSPVEQARAARWVKHWLLKCEFVESETAQDVITALGFYIDKLDPPETVESLRAERDELWREVEQRDDELDKANDEIARLRATHTEAEAAWARIRKSVTYRTTGLGDLAPNGEHWLGGDHSNQTPYPVVRE